MRKHSLYFILYDIFPYQCKQTCTYTSPIKKKKKKEVYTHLHAKQLGKGSLDLVDWRLQLLPKEFDFSEKIKSYLYIGS